MKNERKEYQLLTRCDFDGLVSAALLYKQKIINKVKFVHPRDVESGDVEVTENDISSNLPYVQGIDIAYLHSEKRVQSEANTIVINDPSAKSSARVIYQHLECQKICPDFNMGLVEVADKAMTADFSKEDILNPEGWVLLAFILDERTGLDRYRKFRISIPELTESMIYYLNSGQSLDEILDIPDVHGRVRLYLQYQDDFKKMLKKNSTMHDRILQVDLRGEDIIYPGNRFVKYAIFPDCIASVQLIPGTEEGDKSTIAVGANIFNDDLQTDIGDLMAHFGGGGHKKAGTVQVEAEQTDATVQAILAKLQ